MSAEVVQMNQSASNMPVTNADLEDSKRQRGLLSEFVRSQLVEADFINKSSKGYGEGDFGIIPGTKKRCLFKQGAEKLLRLFGLGVRFKLVDKEFDRAGNFALYVYKAEVYSMKTGAVVAESEGVANSQEQKYRERTVWRTRRVNGKDVRESVLEETPVPDIINTLMKMAQKRALVGATLLATGASEYFTQDVLEPEDMTEPLAPKSEAKPEPKDVHSEIASATPPQCCGKEMMVSKYFDKDMDCVPFYCTACKKKAARIE